MDEMMTDPFSARMSTEGLGLTGRLIVSLPQLDTGPFSQSVVLICRHDEEHALGLIVNKPIEGLTAGDAVADIRESSSFSADTAPIFFGGPVENDRGLVLHTDAFSTEETFKVAERFGISGSREALMALHSEALGPDVSRLIAGHAGWSPGQLDDELMKNYWLDMPATPEFVFGQPIETMWEAALAEIGVSAGSLSALSADLGAGMRPLN